MFLECFNLESLPLVNQTVMLAKDQNGREIKIFHTENVQVVGKHYPGVKLYFFQSKSFFNPIRESIMSLPEATNNTSEVVINKVHKLENRPVFFFIYNVDNYYHFVYDTLPYLISYKHLKSSVPDLKLLMGSANKLNKFVLEFLELLDINESDLIFVNDTTLYSTLYVSSSYTHDGKSNLPPRDEIYSLYQNLSHRVEDDPTLPKKIYISRRSHKHGNYDNIGTNYTTRRCLVNEDELVAYLQSNGYTEVFTELLTTKQKIALFKGCTHVIGPIGGGLCNVLFSRPETSLISIVSPYFLDINSRFKYSFANVDTQYFCHTKHTEQSKYKKYMRILIKKKKIVGEIQEIKDDQIKVIYSEAAVAGWNAQSEYYHMWVSEDEIESIDPGLNSEWYMDMEKFNV